MCLCHILNCADKKILLPKIQLKYFSTHILFGKSDNIIDCVWIQQKHEEKNKGKIIKGIDCIYVVKAKKVKIQYVFCKFWCQYSSLLG